MTGAPEPPGRQNTQLQKPRYSMARLLSFRLVSPALNRLVMQLNNLLPRLKVC